MKALKIVVCLKSVPDPEGPRSAFRVDVEAKQVVPVGIPPVINPYDENALELALRLRERCGGSIIAINLSEKAVTPVLKKALSVGADELILLEDPSFRNLGSRSTAEVLCAAIGKIVGCDLVLTGRQAVDSENGNVGLFLGEMLGIPAVNLVRSVEPEETTITVQRLKRVGYEVIRCPLPAVLTVSSEAGELRLPTLKAIQEVRKKAVTTWRAADLGIEATGLETRRIFSLSPPPSKSRDCRYIEGESSEDKGKNLALRLREDGVV